MRIKKVRAVLAAVIGSMVLALGSNTVAFANVPDNVDTQEGDGVIVEIVDEEEEPEEEPEKEPEDDTVSENGILTPEGNLTLIDDVDEEKAENLQYMTVQTRNGEYFYLIVDRSGNKDNVYFLNMVDESDLIAILSEEDQELIDKLKTPSEEKPEETPIIVENDIEPDDTVEEKPEKKGSPFIMLIVFAVIGAGVAGAYYFFKIKPEKNQIQEDDELEFYDDEDFINEDEAVDEEQEGDSPEDVLEDDFEFLDLDDGGVDSDLGVYDE